MNVESHCTLVELNQKLMHPRNWRQLLRACIVCYNMTSLDNPQASMMDPTIEASNPSETKSKESDCSGELGTEKCRNEVSPFSCLTLGF